MARLKENDLSEVLRELAKKVGSVTGEEMSDEATKLNICEMTVINGVRMNGNDSEETSGREMEPRVVCENVFEMHSSDDFYEDFVSSDGIVVKDGVGNEDVVANWDMSVYKGLKALIIGDGCFAYMEGLKLEGMEALEKVEIGVECFCWSEGKLEVMNCHKLRRVVIGSGSCVNWSEFVMKNCEVEMVEIGDYCFVNCNRTVFEDLNRLRSLTIGVDSMNGSGSTVVMKSE